MISPEQSSTNFREQLQVPYLVENIIRHQRKWREHVARTEENRLSLLALQYHPSISCDRGRPRQ
jgi:hypothetical protein